MSSVFAVAKGPTPVLNTKDFKAIYGRTTLPLDEQGLLRGVETVALPGTKFEILEVCSEGICRVRTSAYPGEQLFVDRRFLMPAEEHTLERSSKLPEKEILISALANLAGKPYVWGGNWSRGVPQMLDLYPPSSPIDETTRIHWTASGVDCSGLLYEATDGYTPRNTAQLVHFGMPVWIQENGIYRLCEEVQALDLIVWVGHVIIVLDSQTAIESRGGAGVVMTPLKERLAEILRERRPVDDWVAAAALGPRFIIRRWYPFE